MASKAERISQICAQLGRILTRHNAKSKYLSASNRSLDPITPVTPTIYLRKHTCGQPDIATQYLICRRIHPLRLVQDNVCTLCREQNPVEHGSRMAAELLIQVQIRSRLH